MGFGVLLYLLEPWIRTYFPWHVARALPALLKHVAITYIAYSFANMRFEYSISTTHRHTG